uniref:Origin recognition complex subunit 4 C-terminal domain-containing protein n=1 Tax=Aegilops tauschii TaxID=37682 RepID=M8C1R7_AEGTA
MAAAPVASQAQAVLRGRLCDPAFVHSRLRSSPDTNYSKLKYLVSSSVSEACNNSVLLLGPRGCGKGAVLDMVLEDLKEEHPDAISVIRLNGMLHSDDNCATKGKQRLLYSLLDAMQSLTSQAVVIGLSCRLLQSGVIYGHGIWISVNGMLYGCAFLHAEATQDGQFARLEDKEQKSYNFNTIMKEYKSIQDAYKTSDKYATTVCFRAFEHLLDRELITFADTKGRNVALEYRPVKLLISSRELAQSLKLNTTCPAVLQKLLDRERYM